MFDTESLPMLHNNIPTGGSALESANSKLESADPNADPTRINVWVQALRFTKHNFALSLVKLNLLTKPDSCICFESVAVLN